MDAEKILMQKPHMRRHAEGIYTVGGQGNSLVVDLGENLLIVDTGPGGERTGQMMENVFGTLDKPLGYIVYSHGHLGYNNGVNQWLDRARERGEPAPRVIAHERVAHRYARYRETAGLQSYTNTRQFRTPYPEALPAHWFRLPDETFSERRCITGRDRSVELFWAPGETDDGTAVWIPDTRTLYGSNAFIKVCPNPGTPFRIMRDVQRWTRTLEGFVALEPLVLIPEFGKPLHVPQDIQEALGLPIRAMKYLRKEVVDRMNAGMGELDILHDVPLPPDIFEHRFMTPGYGCAEYIMRDIWRTENGWWNRNPSDLHPSAPDKVAQAMRDALPDPMRVLEEACRLRSDGQTQLALHVIDLLALADPTDDPLVAQARELKAELCRERSGQVSSAVSQNIYQSMADDLQGVAIGSHLQAGATPTWA